MMGRTLLPFRMALEEEFSTWKLFRNTLKPEDQASFDQLIQYARHHADAGSLAARPLLSEIMFMSIAIEQQKILNKLNFEVRALQDQLESSFETTNSQDNEEMV